MAPLILGEIVRASRLFGETPEQFAQEMENRLRREIEDDIADSLQFIEEFYGRAISLDELAGKAHLSASHFSCKFEAHLGLSPMDYVRI